jgi:hypothetical protein
LPRFKTTLNNRWFVAGLSLLALVLAARALLAPGPGAVSPPAHPVAIVAVATATAPQKGVAAADPMPSVPATARDPFAARPRISSAPPVVDAAHLSALWTENGETLALVNGRILRPGDAVGRMTIESATQEGVWVTHSQGRDFIALGGTFVLTTPDVAAPQVASSP